VARRVPKRLGGDEARPAGAGHLGVCRGGAGPDDILLLLAQHLSGLRLIEFEPDSYELDSGHVCLEVDRWPPGGYDRYPWILAQPWYRSTDAVVQYGLLAHDDDDREARQSIEHAARILADATWGIVLDDDGFRWPQP
jgi:hypothetical protein